MEDQRRYYCCHEAGHAVAGVINGDKLVMVVGYADAAMNPEQKALYDTCGLTSKKAGATYSERGQPNCQCGGKVGGDVQSQRRFCPSAATCQVCLDFVTKEVAVICAGSVATSVLMPDVQPSFWESRDDNNKVNTFLIYFDQEEQRRIYERAKRCAQKWIQEQQEAVLAIAKALQERGVLDGTEAEQIIKAKLKPKVSG
jgi:hypothetical protein